MAIARPTLAVDIRFESGADNDGWVLGTSELPTQLGAPDDASVYTNVWSDVRSLSTNRGRSRELEKYKAGTGSVTLDNRTRNYDPLNLSGTHVDSGVTQIKPGRRIRIKATHPTTGTVYDVFYGVIREWDMLYEGSFDAVSLAKFSDPLTDLSKTDITVTTAAGLSGLAAQDIIDAAGIAKSEIDAGVSSLQATTFTETNALVAMQRTATSEQGAFYADAGGTLQYDDRHALQSETRSNTSQYTLGTGNLPIESIDFDYGLDLVKNAVSITRAGGTAQTDSDTDSINDYGKRSYKLSNLMMDSNAQALSTAQYLVLTYKDPEVRVRSVTLAPQSHADLMTAALNVELRDRVTVTYAPPGGGSAISQELFVEGIRHSFGTNRMKTKLSFSSTERATGWSLGVGDLGTGTILAF